MPLCFRSRIFVFSAAGFMATSTSTESPGVNTSPEENCIWNPLTPGVSGFQIQFSSGDVFTPGDSVDVLVAMNPAALKTNIRDLKQSGILIVNSDAFTVNDLRKAQVTSNPLEDHSLDGYRLFSVGLERLTR